MEKKPLSPNEAFFMGFCIAIVIMILIIDGCAI